MLKLLLEIKTHITQLLKTVDENSQYNKIKSIYKNPNRTTSIELGSLTSNKTICLQAKDILENKHFKDSLSATELKRVKIIALTDGDIFITEKSFNNEHEILKLHSCLTGEENEIRFEDLRNSEFFARLNIRYLSIRFDKRI